MSRRLRFLKAYWSVFIILSSYFVLSLQKKLLGEGWAQDKTALVHRRNARRIERSILELKGLFIKMGQMLSIMSNFLPEALTQGLEGLQDSVPPHPYEAIEKRFQEEFGKNPRELFARFEDTPIASASLGQVHVAYLKDGTKVAVKVQYPEIDEIVKSDLKTLKRIFGLLHLFFPVYGLRSVYGEIAEVILRELDYNYEGKNLEVLKKNFETEADFLFPDVYWDLSSEKILTLRFMEGTKISYLDELKRQGIDSGVVARRIIHAYCKQIFIDGVYHADPP
jgi:predicted unusual protein kinase regulating ubiquinone biosynthesis (AarF/ABC1/UbiB family)